MNPFWAGLVVGAFLGATLGILIAGLCVAARRSDDAFEDVR